MEPPFDQTLQQLLAGHGARFPNSELQGLWRPEGQTLAITPERCRESIDLIEQAFARDLLSEPLLDLYQRLFRQLEQTITPEENRQRHRFIIVIPVADRPQHLRSCLDSLLQLCRAYAYGGLENGHYHKVLALIADDSANPDNRRHNQDLAREYARQGLSTDYFGPEQQLQLLDSLSASTRQALTPILGGIDPGHFHHKGASITRNITYLKLQRLRDAGDQPLLFHFIDSDQEFCVNHASLGQSGKIAAINYLYQLDRIFRNSDTAILTGKVVGDPPVSPAVMAGNLLQDIATFLQQLATQQPEGVCRFHPETRQSGDDAAYHDMAELFGFSRDRAAFDYACPLQGRHDHRMTLSDLAERLARFFYGEHPTRRSYHRFSDALQSLAPARTVYTGNYIFRPECLHYFIPFAPLKLRMAGPVLGRIIRSELGERFASANLPMLHQRTLAQTGRSEYRAGVTRAAQRIDLTLEFERQFYGDIMLFSMERLTAEGLPDGPSPGAEEIRRAVQETATAMQARYRQMQQQTQAGFERLQQIFSATDTWWQGDDSEQTAAACSLIERFIDDIRHNFGEQAAGYRQIDAPRHAARLQQIIHAIGGYGNDRSVWRQLLAGVE